MDKIKIGILGMGYVGLPLAMALQNYYNIYAYDTDKEKINELKKNYDRNNQFSKKKLLSAKNLNFSKNISQLKSCNMYIVAVPTPVKKNNLPDLSLIKKATNDVSKLLSKGNIVVYESTVYPGVTEDFCVPILEKKSKLKFNKDFFCGYSPERINPGDNKNTIENIVKITSGSNKYALNLIDKVYKKIVKVGTFKTKSIKLAEAAKVIENAQRDINIAFINEIKIIFDKIGINIYEVLEASKTKWNFLNFKPGFVGGHCIGVDPFYISYLAKKNNYNPRVILSGREVNDRMPDYEASKFYNKILKKNRFNKKINILVLGATFKENCPDLRNSKALKFIHNLKKDKVKIDVFDPVANQKELKKVLNFNPKFSIKSIKNKKYDGIFIAVNHDYFKKIGYKKISNLTNSKDNVYDFKNLFEKKFN